MVALSRQSYAGFWRRFAGWVVDAIICSIVCSFMSVVVGGPSPIMVFHQVTTALEHAEDGSFNNNTVNINVPGFHMHVTGQDNDSAGDAGALSDVAEGVPHTFGNVSIQVGGPGLWRTELAHILNLLFVLLYVSLLQSSKWQGTLGQMAFGLKVATESGARISWPRALGRYFASYLSAIILGIGYLMIIWTSKRQALHDMIAGTVVLKTE